MTEESNEGPEMSSVLRPPPVPVTFGSHYFAKGESTLKIRCHDRHFRDAVVYDETGEKIFALTAKNPFTSWSVRRSLLDASGHHVVDLRHYKSKLKQWVVESPKEKELCIVKESALGREKSTSAHAIVPTDKGDVIINIRSFDHSGTRTVFEVDRVPIAEMILTENNDISFLHSRGLDRTVWKLRIASGVDQALILALAFCRAEISHAWRR